MVQEKFKLGFQDSRHGGHLGVTIGTGLFTLFTFGVQVTLMLPTKLKVNCPFGSGDEVQNRFSRWPPWRSSWISDRNDFSLFLSTCHQMLPTEFRVNDFNGSGEEVQNRSRRWPPWRPYWISDRNDFSYFLSTCHPDASYQESNQSVQRFRILIWV